MNIAFICTDDDSLAFGMRSISAMLKTHGFNARLIFLETGKKVFSEYQLSELLTLLSDFDVIGISCLAQGSKKAKQVLGLLKTQHKITIWGGVHASLNPADCAEWSDYVCLGEGEGLIVEFMQRVADGEDCKDLLNLAYKQDGQLVVNDLRPLISNLDELPLPDFSFDDEYHLTRAGLQKAFTLYNVERNGQIAFIGSRGCAFHCTYCCNVKLKSLYASHGQYVRRMSVGRLIEHAQQLRRIFPPGRYFYFIDEDFAARPMSELTQLAEQFPKEVGLPFECLAHPARMTKQKLDLLVKAGLFRVRIGVETGSEHTKKEIYDRHVTNEVIYRATKILKTYPQIAPVYFFIYTNPYENRDDLLETLKLIAELPNGSNIQAFELIFFPGSLLHDMAVEDGLITGYADSSSEESYFGGLHHEEYSWKKKNLYLNGLIFLSGGLCTRVRIGMIPRFLFNLLIKPAVIDFNDRHTSFIEQVIASRVLLYHVRFKTVQALKRIIKNPYLIYNMGFFIKNKLLMKSKASEGIE